MSHKLLTQIRNNEIKDFNCLKNECRRWNGSLDEQDKSCGNPFTDECPVVKKMQNENNLYNSETGGFFGCEFCKPDNLSQCDECCHYESAHSSNYHLNLI